MYVRVYLLNLDRRFPDARRLESRFYNTFKQQMCTLVPIHRLKQQTMYILNNIFAIHTHAHAQASS